jgi:hypothetical protein
LIWTLISGVHLGACLVLCTMYRPLWNRYNSVHGKESCIIFIGIGAQCI